MPSAFLSDRRLTGISGKDCVEFLQNLITCDVENLAPGEFVPGALLTPQGKIMFDFLIRRDEDTDGLVLESSLEQQEALVKRLTMYRLRAAVTITALPVEGVSVSWGEDATGDGAIDSRFAMAGVTLRRLPGKLHEGPEEAYDSLRIDCGIAISGRDFPAQDAFPHDVLMDLNRGVSFRKGCFVGQEVVSRMKHRGTARRRVAIISGNAPLTSGQDVTAGGKPAGTLGTVVGNRALAIVRIDRVGDALATGTPLVAGDVTVSAALPAWSSLTFPETAGTAD